MNTNKVYVRFRTWGSHAAVVNNREGCKHEIVKVKKRHFQTTDSCEFAADVEDNEHDKHKSGNIDYCITYLKNDSVGKINASGITFRDNTGFEILITGVYEVAKRDSGRLANLGHISESHGRSKTVTFEENNEDCNWDQVRLGSGEIGDVLKDQKEKFGV